MCPIGRSQGRRVDDDWLPSGELADELDHVLRSARTIARFAIPQCDEGSTAQALRQRRVEYPAIAAVVDTDTGRRRSKLFRHDENRAARVLRYLGEAALPAMLRIGKSHRLGEELVFGASKMQLDP